MSSILTRDETGDGTVREPLKNALSEVMERTEADGSSGRGAMGPFLVVNLGPVADRLLRDGRSRGAEARAESALGSADTEMRSGGQSETDRGSGGRGTLSRLFLLGLVVGLGYVARKRGGSVGQILDRATGGVRSVGDQAADRSGETADRTEAVAGEAAERIQETGEMTADRVQEGSETTAERVEETGEKASERIEESGQTAAERADEAADAAENTTGGSEQGTDEQTDADGGNGESEE